MDRSKLKTVGFSIMRQPGEYKLEVESIVAWNSPYTLGDYDFVDGRYVNSVAPFKTKDFADSDLEKPFNELVQKQLQESNSQINESIMKYNLVSSNDDSAAINASDTKKSKVDNGSSSKSTISNSWDKENSTGESHQTQPEQLHLVNEKSDTNNELGGKVDHKERSK